MRLHPDRLFRAHPAGRQTFYFLGLLLIFLSISCSITIPGGEANIETQTALSIQQTISARQAEKAIVEQTKDQEGTMQAQAALDKLFQDATQTAQQAGEVSEVSQATLDPNTTQDVEQTEEAAAQVPSEQAAPTTTIDMSTMLASANILLFEDMVNDPNVLRYYRDTLDRMGLNYTDVGSAKGKLKAELYTGAPDGEPWDLIILASEYKGSISGEFFDYVNDALDNGSSVILETYYLDKVHTGTARSILIRCGVEYETNWIRVPPQMMSMYPLDSKHPILQEPNSGMTFSDTTSHWAYDFDVGDYMKISQKGDATLVLGTKATDKTSRGTVTVCIDDRMILQTFNSHNLTFDAMRPLIENYIYNALKARFQEAQ
ncbi:hypothetical protein ACFLV7_06630 [Chloroflexota bacterium]